jgi:hypothetical protein
VLPEHGQRERSGVRDFVHEHGALRKHKQRDRGCAEHRQVHPAGVRGADNERERRQRQQHALRAGWMLLGPGACDGQDEVHCGDDGVLEPEPFHKDRLDKPDVPAAGLCVPHGEREVGKERM